MREVYWIGDRFIVELDDGRVEEFDRGTYNGSSIIFFQSAGNARSDE